jgi:SpoVK/Ycf46/Vps4 family AAA+-type ATPase
MLMRNVADGIERPVVSAADERGGGLADLVTTERPAVRLSDLTLAPATRAHLERVLHEQRRRDLLASHGFAPLRRLLLAGPPGTGKSVTAAALAAELSLPLVTIRIDPLLGRYTGEPAAKLRVVFDAMASAPAVCLFDEFDAIGTRPMTGYQQDIVEARRALSTFLSFVGDIRPDSLIVTVTDQPMLLDEALLRRFELVIPYALPNPAQAVDVLRRRLAAVNTSEISWDEVGGHVKGLSQAGLVRAAESAAKRTLLSNCGPLSTAALVASLDELRGNRHVAGFSRGR